MSLVGNDVVVINERGERLQANITSYRHPNPPGMGPDFQGAVESSPDHGFAFWNAEQGGMRLVVSLDGYETQEVITTCPQQVRVTLKRKMALPHLEQRGNDFVDADGKRIVFPGIDGFDDLFFRVNGRESELDALMVESVQIGFPVRRIFCMGDAGENQVFSLYPQNVPNYFDMVRGLVAYENAKGIIPLLTCFVDAQRVMPNQGQRQAFWRDLNAALIGSGSYLMSGGNEAFKNGFDPVADLSDPGHGVIWSRGSDKEDVTPITDAPATELHATRNSFSRALMDTTASPPYMRSVGARGVWMTEGNPFGDGNGYTAPQAWQLGRGYSIDWALAIHHNRQSQRGLLMNPDTAETAAQWVRGMAL